MSRPVLFISPVLCLPGHSGRSIRIFNLIQSFESRKCDVYFAFLPIRKEGSQAECQQYFGNKYHEIPFVFSPTAKHKIYPNKFQRIQHKFISFFADNLDINNPIYNHGIDDWYCEESKQYLIELADQILPEIVVVEFVFLSWALELFNDKVVKVIDTIDLFANNYKLVDKQKRSAVQFSTPPAQELLGLERADIVIAIQNSEKEYFAQRLTRATVIEIGHSVKVKPPIYNAQTTANIGFLGTPNVNNIEGLEYFIDEIFPLVKAKNNRSQLILAGGICDQISHTTHKNSIIKLGNVDNLDDFYDMVDVVVNPVLRGKGLSIKTIEALGMSKPVVATVVGARGLDQQRKNGLICAKNTNEFAEAIVELFINRENYHQLSLNAYNFAQSWNQGNDTAIEKIINFKEHLEKLE